MVDDGPRNAGGRWYARSTVDRLPTAAPASRPGAAAALLAATTVLLVAAVFRGDGSRAAALPELGIGLALIAVATAIAVRAGALELARPGRDGWLALGAVTTLAGWAAVTIVWSIAGDLSWIVANRTVVYVGFLGLGLAVGALGRRSTRAAAAVIGGVLLGAVGWALLGKMIPALDPGADRVGRLRQPVEYWNALALLAGALIAFAVWAGTRRIDRAGVRAAAAVVVTLAVVTVALTVSRAGAAGAVLAVAVSVALLRERVEAGLLVAAGAVPAVGVAIWAFTDDALLDDGVPRDDRVTAGSWLAVALVLAACLAVGLSLAIPRLLERRRSVGRLLLWAGVAAVAAGAIAVGVAGGVSGDECTNDPDRLGSLCANDRLDWWAEALAIFRDDPIGGSGAGTFGIARLPYREDGREVSQPHSVPLQVLAGQGIVGFALLALLVGAVAVGSRRALGRLGDDERSAAIPLVALTAVYGLHALVDYDAEFVAVTAPTLVAAGAVFAAGRPAADWRPSLPGIVAVAVTGLAVSLSLASPPLAERQVDRVYAAVDAGDLDAARDDADLAARLNPLALEPLWAQALVAERRGDLERAHALYIEATRLQPRNPLAHYELGVFRLLALEDACRAYAALNDAYTLDQRNSSLWIPGGPLDRARDAVNSGACERQASTG